MASRVRLFVDQALGEGQLVVLSRDQAHYLFGVMRLSAGAELEVFNGSDGAWLAEVSQAGKRGGELTCRTLLKPQGHPPDLWLLFAPIKKARTDFIVEKAVEMGVARILPVLTEFTNSERVRQDRLQAHAVEAAEQCGITYVPQVHEAQKLNALLQDWETARRLLFCDETLAGSTCDFEAAPGPWAILIGPEGGFSATERQHLGGLPFSVPVALGPRILRADTAAVAALTLWQTRIGDWA